MLEEQERQTKEQLIQQAESKYQALTSASAAEYESKVSAAEAARTATDADLMSAYRAAVDAAQEAFQSIQNDPAATGEERSDAEAARRQGVPRHTLFWLEASHVWRTLRLMP